MLKKYNGYEIGPNLRKIRKDKKLSLYQVCEITGLSDSSIKQIEQGGRGLSMRTLYLLMSVYQCDANTLLNIEVKESNTDKKEGSIDSKLEELPSEQQDYFRHTFEFMIDQAAMLVS
ncbi:Transcriptional regulator, contains XRE-family HTH domain [Anaerosporobacter mobilis DSM 15930]|jgi:transcriptional regulator with XRE-family HTH domain|uniref:Transcriptional regulator, contains XRE-family HTH domain n=1 Tax=Anaerosporobacter mobilis DSM 15930 TaxID=1120996 RepID=A0A1M7HHG3_9FIRM|nr:helix-turn-helix transcriptional regulator [Anaerosporobacter mobilis]SHM27922.1 Transcriptional regulator, contains XRE-family HTH domain [Anaerosporobacter mobilis DSM 15930]